MRLVAGVAHKQDGRLVGVNFERIRAAIPMAVSVFPDEIFAPPRAWCEPTYRRLFYWNRTARGGHFAAFEQPAIFVAELRKAFALTRASFG